MHRNSYEELFKEIEIVEKARKIPPLSLEEFVSEFEWLLMEYAVCEYKIFGNVIILYLFNGQKFRLTIEEIKKATQDSDCFIKG